MPWLLCSFTYTHQGNSGAKDTYTQEVGPPPHPCLTPFPRAHRGLGSSPGLGASPWALPTEGQALGPLMAARLHLCQLWRSRLLGVPSRNSDRWTSVIRGVVPSDVSRSRARSGSGAAMLDCSGRQLTCRRKPFPPLPLCPPVALFQRAEELTTGWSSL